jgi:hypothetical protein
MFTLYRMGKINQTDKAIAYQVLQAIKIPRLVPNRITKNDNFSANIVLELCPGRNLCPNRARRATRF